MELYEVMRTTGSTRRFLTDPVPDEVLHRVLDNAASRGGANLVPDQPPVFLNRRPATRHPL
jgi:hypothetical protein